MGYAAGTTPSPTYRAIGDHAECLEVDFDPTVISFEGLLARFWEWHNPFRRAYGRQYMSAVLYHSQAQLEAAQTDLRRFADQGRQALTEIIEYQGFTLAEDYHQKYYVRRHREVAQALKAQYPNLEQFIDSYQVMKVNAMLGGAWTPDPVELAALDLAPEVRAMLAKTTRTLWQRLVGT